MKAFSQTENSSKAEPNDEKIKLLSKKYKTVTTLLAKPNKTYHAPIPSINRLLSQNRKLNILAKLRLLSIFPKPFTQFFIPFPKLAFGLLSLNGKTKGIYAAYYNNDACIYSFEHGALIYLYWWVNVTYNIQQRTKCKKSII